MILQNEVRPVENSSSKPVQLATLLFLAYALLIAQFQGIQNILVPMAVERLAPTTKVSTLATLATLAAIATVIAMFAGGWVSDRTRSRWGRRTPSLLLSAAATALFSAMMGHSTSIAALTLAMPLMWFAANYYQTVLTAILPDRVAPAHLGFVAAAIALGVPIGIFVGVNIAAYVPSPAWGYALLNLPFLAATVALAILAPEEPSLDLDRASLAKAGGTWLDAFRSRDFTLAFVSRFVLFLAYFTVVAYLFYVLQDYVGRSHLPGGDVAAALGKVLSLSTIAWLVVTPLTALIADRIGHTGAVVGVTSFVIGAAMLVPAFSNGWPAMLLFGVGMGLTFGVYFAIDLKLVSMVLPSAETAGRDIGLMSIAGSGPTVFAPALAAAIIQYGSFPALFGIGAALALLGGLFAFPIRARGSMSRER